MSTHAPVACALAKLPALSNLVYVAGHFVEWPAFFCCCKEAKQMALPNDPIMLLSVVNLKLRDQYKDLDALCEDLEADKAGLCTKLHAVGYDYDPQRNQFV